MEDTRDSTVDRGPGNGRWSTRVWAPRALVGVAVVAIGAAGGVHAPVRAGLAVLALVVGLACLREGTRRWAPGRGPVGIGVALALILGWTAAALLPLGPVGRSALQPGLAEVLGVALDAAGRTTHPLAVNPRAALVEWALWVGLFALGAGTAAVVRTRTAARETARALTLLAVAVALLGFVQQGSGAESVYWVTGLGLGNRTPFFGPFVNQNQAAAGLAAGVPLALAGSFATAGRERFAWVAAAVLLVLATIATGSRSALPLLAAGTVAAAFVSGRPVAVRIAGGCSALVLLAGLLVGPGRVVSAIAPGLGPEGDDPWSGRVSLWQDALRLVGDAPIVGVGLGGFGDAALVVKSTPAWVSYAHAHQEPLEVAVEQGAPVLLALAAVAVAAAMWGLPRLRALPAGSRRTLVAGLVGATAVIGTASLWDFPLRAAGIAATAAILLGAVVGLLDAKDAPGAGLRGLQGAISALALAAGVALVGWFALAASPTSVWGSSERALEAGRAVVRTDPAAAEVAFRTAIARRPLDVDGLLGLAEARWREGDGPGAVDLVRVATRVQPTSERAWLALARLHRARGEVPAAAEAYRRHLALDQQNPYALDALREAFTLGVAIEDVLPERPDRRCWGARILDGLGDRLTAQILYEETAPLLPRCSELYAEDLVRWGDPKRALEVSAGVEAGCGRDRVAGFALEALGRHREALERLDAAMHTCTRKDTRLRVTLGRARLGTGDLAGLAILEHLVEEQPDAPWIRRALIQSYDDLGLPGRARPQLEALRDAGVATSAELARLGP